MFSDFLNHKCDIYHMADDQVNAGYGIKAADTAKVPKELDLTDIPCHFYVGTTLNASQHEPYADIEGNTKLALPYGTDIRINDTVINKEDGTVYKASGVPRTVHGNHHIIVMLEHETGEPNAI